MKEKEIREVVSAVCETLKRSPSATCKRACADIAVDAVRSATPAVDLMLQKAAECQCEAVSAQARVLCVCVVCGGGAGDAVSMVCVA